MRRALVTTTINPPTEQLRAWLSQLKTDDVVVIVGDRKTPQLEFVKLWEEFPDLEGYYVDVESTEFASERVTGFNTIQRRNLGFLRVLKIQANGGNIDYVITVDDDNEPGDDEWVGDVDEIMLGKSPIDWVLKGHEGWADPGELSIPRTTHRGFPLEITNTHRCRETFRVEVDKSPVGVFCSIITGDPDISAVERLLLAPIVDAAFDATIAPRVWAPFNTQATAIRTELLPAMHLWLGVGRYDDIFASFVTQRIMWELGYVVRFGNPTAHQNRNPHNLLRDLNDELFGYRNALWITDQLSEINLSGTKNVLEMTHLIYQHFNVLRTSTTTDITPYRMIRGMQTWLEDIRRLGYTWEGAGA